MVVNTGKASGDVLGDVRLIYPGSDNSDGIFVLTADVHYQSTDRATFGKAPDFYGAQT